MLSQLAIELCNNLAMLDGRCSVNRTTWWTIYGTHEVLQYNYSFGYLIRPRLIVLFISELPLLSFVRLTSVYA